MPADDLTRDVALRRGPGVHSTAQFDHGSSGEICPDMARNEDFADEDAKAVIARIRAHTSINEPGISEEHGELSHYALHSWALAR